jgi:glycosyltransferase involved in cell wall biosynthesis
VTTRPLRIAYVTTYDSRDVRAWSGSGYHIAEALIAQGQEVLRIGPLDEQAPFAARLRQWAAQRMRGRFHPLDREPAVLDHYAAEVRRAVHGTRAEVVLSPGIIPVAHLDSGLPQVVWTDATFAGVVDTYPEFSRLTRRAIAQGHASERAALARSALTIFTSRWAHDTAVTQYRADPTRLAVIPFGANVALDLDDAALERRIATRLAGPPRLVFIGVDWQRKGGPLLLQVLRLLRQQGTDARLTVIGCRPEIPADLQASVAVLGFISKQDAAGRARLDAALAEASLHVLLSAHECFGLVLCEACAHGLPSLTTTAEGIPTIIRDGDNGLADPVGTPPQRLAERVRALLADREAYAGMCRRALASYRREFNWQVAGRRVVELLRGLVTDAQ